jgi:hypothetical protein
MPDRELCSFPGERRLGERLLRRLPAQRSAFGDDEVDVNASGTVVPDELISMYMKVVGRDDARLVTIEPMPRRRVCTGPRPT